MIVTTPTRRFDRKKKKNTHDVGYFYSQLLLLQIRLLPIKAEKGTSVSACIATSKKRAYVLKTLREEKAWLVLLYEANQTLPCNEGKTGHKYILVPGMSITCYTVTSRCLAKGNANRKKRQSNKQNLPSKWHHVYMYIYKYKYIPGIDYGLKINPQSFSTKIRQKTMHTYDIQKKCANLCICTRWYYITCPDEAGVLAASKPAHGNNDDARLLCNESTQHLVSRTLKTPATTEHRRFDPPALTDLLLH